MKIPARTILGLLAAAILATGFATGVAAAASGPPSPDHRGPRAQQDAITTLAAGANAAGTEQLFVPITPCRIVDTRAGGGKLAANSARSFYVSGATGFSGQGGKSTGCDIPVGATGVAVSLTTTQASASGRIVAYPSGVTTPNSTMLSYTSTANATSTPTVALTPGTARQMTVKSFSASTHLVIDVLGYYVQQMSALLNEDGDFIWGARVLSTYHEETGIYAVQFDSDITHCNGVGSSDDTAVTVSVYPSEDVAWVYVFDTAGAPVDEWSNIVIVC